MKTILLAALLALSTTAAFADTTCVAGAIDKNGKPLAGAAKTANVNKCMKEAVGQ